MKCYYINPYTDTAEVREVDHSLEAWYDLIGCRCVDIVGRQIGGKWFNIICDDEGTFVEDCRISAISDMGQIMLVGALLVCGGTDENGELTGLTDDEVRHIERYVQHQGTRRHPEGWRMLMQMEW